MPDFSLEDGLTGPVAGIDEAGRGPWAGPVVAAAAILDPTRLDKNLLDGLDDSKALSRQKRESLYSALFDLRGKGVDIGIGAASVVEIDRINILQATMIAMARAVGSLSRPPACALIDGNKAPQLPCPAHTVIKGDAKSLSIAAASIIAKVTRDRIMTALARRYPAFGWETNAGYGTKAHQTGLKNVGITAHHRRSFKPIRMLIVSVPGHDT
ncbi:MAG: ribonuclease HII [Rhodospirillaceae bacterium]|jgi:ribonuclease HII|nr:ribonuclease HII [Rhodospirillaceae bacterium]MBT5660182.1 ribonuclease HII [Rhodospirillaceae bacterium]MBT5751372.1 ribonuclease HII [Rhodospirillaceae bacterium]